MKTPLKTTIVNLLTQWQQTGKLPADLNFQVQIDRARDARFGDFACNVAMQLAKPCQRSPLVIAEEIATELRKDLNTLAVSAINVAAPGFINFKMADSAFEQVLRDVLFQGKNYGRSNMGKNQSVHMEVVSANPTGPLHVGHGRYVAYGGSLANLLNAVGYRVHSEYYVNDAGRQMRILAASVWLRYLELWGETFAFPRRGYKGDYIVDIAKTLKVDYQQRFVKPLTAVLANLPPDDEEQQEKYIDSIIERAESLLGEEDFNIIFERGLQNILQDIHDDMKEFGVTCERWFHESELFKNDDVKHGIDKLRQGGFLYEKDGATWFRSTDFGDEKDRVVVRANGQSTYFASDVAYHLNKYERGFDKLLDIYGADHHGYIPRLRALVQALGHDVSKLEVLLVQFAVLYRGKTRVQMSTRGGEFVTLRELREEVGNDAARFFYIMRKREQHLDFDLELAKSQSSDNPVYYIQYAHARIFSVFRQLAQKQLQWQVEDGEKQLALLQAPHEKSLMRCLSRYPEIMEAAAQAYEPSTVAYYLQEVANEFHAYYNALPFIAEEKELRDARLYLVVATRQVLQNGLGLLGVSAPEMM